jgi:sphingomyelin phosphodiesterase 2
VLCTWRWPKSRQRRAADVVVPLDTPDPEGKRIDYIFAGHGAPPGGEEGHGPTAGAWVVRDARVAMTQRHPQLGCSLSDHFAVEATLAFHHGAEERAAAGSGAGGTGIGAGEKTATYSLPSGGGKDGSRTEVDEDAAGETRALHNGAYLQSPTGSEIFNLAPAAGPRLASFADDGPAGFLPGAAYDEILAAVRTYVARERSQRWWRGAHFFAAVVASVACLVGVWFSPHNYVAFILMLVSSLGLVAGAVDGLLALLFFNWELRTLKEFEWEVRNTKALADGVVPDVQATDEGTDRGW